MEPLSPALEAVLERLAARIDWERADRGALRQDLAPVRDLLARLGNPQRGPRTVHIGGTKGKGSVAALVAAALSAAGERVGLYASPHVERVTERAKIDGVEVEDGLLARSLEAALAALADAEREATPAAAATWFDLMTAGALLAFRGAGSTWNVVEVGLGGRLDSTNVVEPEACAITSIDLEHTDVLGDTLAAIAAEKAGILKPGAPCTCGVAPEGEAGRVIAARAREVGAPLRWVAPASGLDATNRALAADLLDSLGRDPGRLGEPAVQAAARLPGRMERAWLGGVPVVLDGAHVAGSLAAVLADLGRDPALTGPCVAVLALGRDKDAPALLKALRAGVDRVHCTSVGARQRAAGELADLAVRHGLVATADDSPEGAVAAAAADAGRDGWVLVTGSLHLVGAVRAAVSVTRTRTPGCSPSAPTSS